MAPNASAARRHAASQSGAGAGTAGEAGGVAVVAPVAPALLPFALSGLLPFPPGGDGALSPSPPPSAETTPAMTPSVTGEDSERCSDGAGDIGGLAAEWFPLPFKDNDIEEEEDASAHRA